MVTTMEATEVGSRFLVIDDEKDIADVVGQIIALTGNQATSYTNPVRAVHAFVKDPQLYDAVITDLRMPQMNGLQVVATIRQQDPAIPVVVITANETAITRQQYDELAIYRLIKKPFAMDDLIDVVNEVTGQSN